MNWQEAIRRLIAQKAGLRRGFCSINNQEYHNGPDLPNSQHAGEIQWDYRRQSYMVLNVYTDQVRTDLQTEEEVGQAFELLGVTNSEWS